MHQECCASQTWYLYWPLHTCNFRQGYEVCSIYIATLREGRRVILKGICSLPVLLYVTSEWDWSCPVRNVGFIVNGILLNNIISYAQWESYVIDVCFVPECQCISALFLLNYCILVKVGRIKRCQKTHTRNKDNWNETYFHVYGGLFCMCLWSFKWVSSLLSWFTFQLIFHHCIIVYSFKWNRGVCCSPTIG